MTVRGAQGRLVSAVHATGNAGYAVTVRLRTHEVAADEPVARGGTDTGGSPMELLLAGLASCTLITLRMYAERKRWELGEVKVDCRLFEEDGARHVVERQLRFGAPLDDSQRTKLLEIAERTPVTKIVAGATPIRTRLADGAAREP
jgi:putative redox protein